MILTLDKVIGVIAPHTCIACGLEGSVLCSSCLETAGEPIIPRCVGCHKLSTEFKTCQSCKHWLKADAVFVATVYEGIYEQLIKAMKFDAKRQASEPVAKIMMDALINLPEGTLVCPLPTAPSRIRERGFDHTIMLAKYIAKSKGLEYKSLLGRKTNVRQLGSTRSKRLEQMEQEFYAKDPEMIIGRNILLVDDVVTTGASISGAASELKKAGAKSVRAVVFAQKL
jgi:ComF family protein